MLRCLFLFYSDTESEKSVVIQVKYHQKWVLFGIVNLNILQTHYLILKTLIIETIQAIKPGPKPKTDEGKDDKRRRVNPENQPKHPDLKPHKHEPND